MNDVLHFSIQDNGFYSSIPQALKLILALTTGALNDWLIAANYITITNARKIFVGVGMYVIMWIFVVHFSNQTAIEYLCSSSLFVRYALIFFSVYFHRYFYHRRFICRMWSILCGRLFYHFDCIPRCARYCNQCARFKSKLCKHFNGHWWYGNIDNGHSGAVFGWRAYTKCKFICYFAIIHCMHINLSA